MNSSSPSKRVIVHLGPHKTGTTAIQKTLASAGEVLAVHGVSFLHDPLSHAAGLALASERFEEAEVALAQLSAIISDRDASCVVLSQEDFPGHLIGRSRKRQIYPKLTKNLRIIKRALRPHKVQFVFFVREETSWLRSCYHQHLRYRTRFWNFEEFATYYGGFFWADKLARPREIFGEDFKTFEYDADRNAGLNALLSMASGNSPALSLTALDGANASPTVAQIARLERVNELTDFPSTAWFAKSLILKGHPIPPEVGDPTAAIWPPRLASQPVSALPALSERSQARVPKHDCIDILPAETVDLDALATARLPREVETIEASRADIRDQSRILEYHLRGKSRLNHLNALCISYLRRDTEHTAKARVLFHRIWREKAVLLVNELSTRWLISTLQTFLDHGLNEAQRSIGTAGYFYANLMKIYEGERAIEGLAQDAAYAGHEPETKNRFRGLDRYKVGGSDLMLNTNALALEIAYRDPVAGLVLQEFLLRVKASETVFSRHDRTRHEQNINVADFENTWAFFEPWTG